MGIFDTLMISRQRVDEIENKIKKQRVQSRDTRDMIHRLFPEQKERHIGSIGFLIMMLSVLEDSPKMLNQIDIFDNVRDLFELDRDTIVTYKLIISQTLKSSNGMSDFIKKICLLETTNDSDREFFVAGMMLGMVTAQEMINSEIKSNEPSIFQIAKVKENKDRYIPKTYKKIHHLRSFSNDDVKEALEFFLNEIERRYSCTIKYFATNITIYKDNAKWIYIKPISDHVDLTIYGKFESAKIEALKKISSYINVKEEYLDIKIVKKSQIEDLFMLNLLV